MTYGGLFPGSIKVFCISHSTYHGLVSLIPAKSNRYTNKVVEKTSMFVYELCHKKYLKDSVN